MAKNRMLSTSFWNDGYTANLDPIEKLLFIYLLTNERSTLAGVYQLPVKIMAVETGIETEMVRKILGRFEDDGKIQIRDGWVAIRNFAKHHPAGSPTVKKGIEDALAVSPDWAKGYIKGIDTLSPSAFTSASVSSATALPYDEIHEEEVQEVQERPKNPPKYPNKKEVLSWFPEVDESWNINTTELRAMELLYKKGEEKVRKIIRFSKENMGNDGFPIGMITPYLLITNWVKISQYAKRNQ